MNKKLITALVLGTLSIILIQFFITDKDNESSNGRPSPRATAKVKVSPKLPPTPRQAPQPMPKKEKNPNLPLKKTEVLSAETTDFIQKNIVPNELRLNGESYKLVKGLVVRAGDTINRTPLFKLYNYNFYKSNDSTSNDKSDMSVVLNTNTDTLGIITGKIVLNLFTSSSIEELINKYDLNLEYKNLAIGTIIVTSDRPLQTVFLTLSNDPNVRDAELEIIESEPVAK